MNPSFPRAANRNIHRRARGVSLIEVLVTTIILAFGLLGLAALLSKSTTLASEAYARTVSTERIYSLADRMRLNPKGVKAGNYDNLTGGGGACDICTIACAPGSIAAMDYCEWSNELSVSLPGGTGTVQRNGSAFDITVNWVDPRMPAGQQDQSQTLRVRP